jgi:hypothetical protein
MAKMAQGMWICGGLSMQTQDSCKDSLCFKSHPILGNFWVQACNCFLLWKIIIIGIAKPCAKSSSSSTSTSSCQYLRACGLAMCVEPKLKKMVAFGCPLLLLYHLYVKCG